MALRPTSRRLTRRAWAALLVAAWRLRGQSMPQFTCPMDPDVKLEKPGRCPRCGMTLVEHAPEFREYPIRFRFVPPTIPARVPLNVSIEVPGVSEFDTMHEKQMHLFIVSADLAYFSHEHPIRDSVGFSHRTVLPREGLYKLVADFYPHGGLPQLGERLVTTAGWTRGMSDATTTVLDPVLAPQTGKNITVSLRMEQPLPGRKSLLFFDLDPADKLEPYLGAWAHMLMVSEDLIDTIHQHPSIADGSKSIQFDVYFPRATRYRIWIQCQRDGQVSTVAFTIPVSPL